jgi:gas vesicle protein
MADSSGSKAIWFVAGFSVGAAMALLLAPRSGGETREFIGKKAEEGRDYVSAKGKEFRRAAEDLVDKGKDLVAKIPV